ncbi:MAG: hypothetical protein H0X66_22270 [Verrucomicrobia bacterium]|nr:hypothetical protein [Verrucomicrobiota bacterium]
MPRHLERGSPAEDLAALQSNLIKRGGIKQFSDYMAAEYKKETGIEMTRLLCQAADGAA